MKKFFILFVVILLNLTANSQSFDIKFTNKNKDYLYLDTNNNYFLLSFSYLSCIDSTKHIFYGKYKITKRKIILNSKNMNLIDSFSKSTYILNNQHNNNIFSFTVLDIDSNPIPNAVIGYNIDKKRSKWILTDSRGKANIEIKELPIDSIIVVGLSGYQSLFIKINTTKGSDYTIFLYRGNIVIHRKKEKFRFNFFKDSLYLSNKNYLIKLKINNCK